MDLQQLLECRSARALDEDTDGHVLISSDLTGTFQLYERGDELRQLTDFSEPATGKYLPGSRHAVVQMDSGGNERHQLYLMDLDAPPLSDLSRLDPLTSAPDRVHHLLGVRPGGGQIAFTSNQRNGIDFDVHVLDLETRQTTTIYADGGWVQEATGYSSSGRYLSFLLPGPRPLDQDLCLVDLTTGELSFPMPHPDEAALVSGPAWASESGFFVSSDIGRDFAAIVWHDLSSGESVTILEEEHDLECVASTDGSILLVIANVDGASRAELFQVDVTEDPPKLSSLQMLPLPGRGVIASTLVTPHPLVGPEGLHVTYTFSSPLITGDAWRVERSLNATRRLTNSPGVAPEDLVEPTLESVTAADGERIPLFAYRRAGSVSPVSSKGSADSEGTAGSEGTATGPPVVVVIHGGPESDARLTFNPMVQGLLSRGFAVLVPNVRGSTGYGKRYASLDDTTRRLDSVADLAAIHHWMSSVALDAGRAALYGGSYGGYMVLAGLAFQPELWAAGVDIVGISDLVTFLENTSAYRREHREREYGSLTTDREFLESASPLRKVDSIKAPLFVIHGENDPRVPVSEARQLVASLERRGIPHELLIFEDEGHGLGKLKNRLVAYPQAVAFLERHLSVG